MGMGMVYITIVQNIEDTGFYWRWIARRNTSDVLQPSKPMENSEQILGARNIANENC